MAAVAALVVVSGLATLAVVVWRSVVAARPAAGDPSTNQPTTEPPSDTTDTGD